MSSVYAARGLHRRLGLKRSRVVAIAASALALVRAWRQRSRDRCLLAAMSEREFQDIGTCWSKVANDVAKPFWKQQSLK
ncbi:hypothetical protein CQ14_20210 [Bradyrhizobium lablabi]|uniref:DUF1127 domain-containing protein n=1 Tax=Bradyrhizobium lablabi TaxID=722472 RepID=A0A0R3N3K9_9BRAD|nr:hypothetical protein CQ14_20210 [Bradyrhizobium lablabi]